MRFDFPPELGLLAVMATATLTRPAARKRLWTYDEMVAELPESNLPVELWNGDLVMSPTPNPSHQRIVFNLATLFRDFVVAKKLGEVFLSPLDVILTQRHVVQPDVFFISKARLAHVTDRVRCAPDLAVEVLSPGRRRRDRVDKKALYERFGVREYWIVDPEACTIEVLVLEKGVYRLHALAEQGERAASKLLAGFSVTWLQLVL
jgi:Uma2 family endonuclease